MLKYFKIFQKPLPTFCSLDNSIFDFILFFDIILKYCQIKNRLLSPISIWFLTLKVHFHQKAF